MPTSLTLEHYEMMHDTMPLMQAAVSEFSVDPKAVDAHLVGVANELQNWANGVLSEFRNITKQCKASAEEVLSQAMMALGDAERHQFLLTNLLEGLKRGDSPADMVTRYNAIGLADIKVPEAPTVPASAVATFEPAIAQTKPAGTIRKMMNGLASMCSPAINMALIAAKAISDRLKIKFKPITGTMAGLPSLHFLLALEGEVKVSEVFEFLKSLFRRSSESIG